MGVRVGKGHSGTGVRASFIILVLMACGWLACRYLDYNIRSYGAYMAGARRWGNRAHKLRCKVPVQPGEESQCM